MDEIVDFSYDAVHDIDPGSNHIAIDPGEQLTMEECLNAILIRSANEVSFAVAEHISGTTWQDFAPIMNERAKELGCVDSNFVNPNGLPNEDHYTSAYDLAMIGRAFFANEALCKMTMTHMLHILPSERQPDDIMEVNKMELIPGGKYAYPYLVGCKTGYTDVARSTLVSCAEKDGMKLICVVMKDENPNYYEDTIALFDYGFSNFQRVNISQTETKYNIENAGSFYSGNDIFGNSKPILELNQTDSITLPNTITFQDAVSSISYDNTEPGQVAVITYTYNDVYWERHPWTLRQRKRAVVSSGKIRQRPRSLQRKAVQPMKRSQAQRPQRQAIQRQPKQQEITPETMVEFQRLHRRHLRRRKTALPVVLRLFSLMW